MSHSHSDHTHTHDHHDFKQANEEHFDKAAPNVEHEHPYARELGIKNVEAMRETYPDLFDKERTEVLDFACGTGLVSQALRPYVKSIVGVDISQGSVDIYNKQAADMGFADQMKAVRAELKGEPGELDGRKFDLITCCLSYHHMPDIDEVTRALAFFLKPGGSLLVIDIKAAPEGKVLFPERYHHVVPQKHGLSVETMRKTFEGAGLVDLAFKDLEWGVQLLPDVPPPVGFLARGVKPAGGA
ncbi:S-adenosyl-L-methionine-dependent methyltransferase [Trametes polyzona]|nr:S-adenosyl-L-methionine-dependent methyltransferase [Trametes polyzona]